MDSRAYKFDLQRFGFVSPTNGNTHISSNFGELMEPGLRKIFFETYDEVEEEYSKLYNIEKSTKQKETDWGMGAFGDWTKRSTNLSDVDYKKLSPGDERTYVHESFTQGFMVERELADDDQYRQIQKMPAAMARSGRAKIERDAAAFLGLGFGADIYDGKKLFSNEHPLLDVQAGQTGKNLLTGSTSALSADSIKAGVELMQETLDEAGNLAQFRVTKLFVPPALLDTAIRVTQSDRVSGTANNDTNKYLNGYGIEIVPLNWLGAAAGGSDVEWYMQDGNRHELNFFWRIKPEFKWAEDFDNFVAKYRGYMRYSYGVSDWRGLVGAKGV